MYFCNAMTKARRPSVSFLISQACSVNRTLILRVSSAVQLTLIKRGQRSRIAGALDEEFGQVR